MQKKKIGILADWKSLSRYNGWEQLLRELKPDDYEIEFETFRLANLVATGAASLGAFIQDLDALIVNWDAANGDPAFGSHLALLWLEHRGPEILNWLRGGKVLIIEGQAMMSMPSKRAYDALSGRGELPVCGPEDPENPLKQKLRTGRTCRKTSRAPNFRGFERIDDIIENKAESGPTYDMLFPGSAALLAEHITDVDWPHVLYRGWFRRVFPGSTRLPWVSIVETSDRGAFKNHSTMKVAKIGEEGGAIFATTMFLASTKQKQLVLAMLNCTNKNTSHLPGRRSLVDALRKGWSFAVSILAGVVAGVALLQNEPVLTAAMSSLSSVFGEASGEVIRAMITVVFIGFGAAAFWVATKVAIWLKKQASDIIGF